MHHPPSRGNHVTNRSCVFRHLLARWVKPLTAAAGLIGMACALSAPANAKALGELRLECGQAIALSRDPTAVGVDVYQIATCFAYLEAHIDMRPALFCLPQDLAMSAIAERILHETEADDANANASDALTTRLRVSAPCPESGH
jgi:hypothetical protein